MKLFALALAVCSFFTNAAAAKDKAAEQWVEHKGGKFTEERQGDGDSFGMEIKTPKGNPTLRTYRLYGVDCPESDAEDKVLAKRIEEQAEYFGRAPEDIPVLGKEASAFTEKLLRKGDAVIFTHGPFGKRAKKNPGRPQRYYALVEVTDADGKRRMLHELLLEAGLARAYGIAAAWPPVQEDRHGEDKACEKFMADLERLERKARVDKKGAWQKAAR